MLFEHRTYLLITNLATLLLRFQKTKILKSNFGTLSPRLLVIIVNFPNINVQEKKFKILLLNYIGNYRILFASINNKFSFLLTIEELQGPPVTNPSVFQCKNEVYIYPPSQPLEQMLHVSRFLAEISGWSFPLE